jgi:protein-disulfide isomerase
MNDTKSKILIAVFLLLFTAISIALVVPAQNKDTKGLNEQLLAYSDEDPQISFGEPKAVLIEYSDFQCPYCAIFDQSIISPVIEKKIAGSTFVFKHLPLKGIHPNAVIAAVASEAAKNQNKFFEYKDLLYQNQNNWNTLTDPSEIFLDYAESLNLDLSKFENDLSSASLHEKIENKYNIAIENGLKSTPTLFLNGEQNHVRTAEELEELI